MNGLMTDLRALLMLSLRDPRQAAGQLMAMGVPMQARWLGLALAAVLSLLVMKLTLMTMPAEELSPFALTMSDPVIGLVVQTGSILMMAGAMAFGGRIFGGRGRFEDALLLTVWVELVLCAIALLQFAVLLVLPTVAILLSFAAIVLFIWLLVNFTAALHGFKNLLAVLGGMAATFVFIVLALAVILAILGITPPQGPF